MVANTTHGVTSRKMVIFIVTTTDTSASTDELEMVRTL
jgi:hypothetical protein